MKTYMDVTHAACKLGVRERQVLNLVTHHGLPHRKIGKEYYFDEDEVDAWWRTQPGQKFPVTFKDPQPAPTRVDPSPDVPTPNGLPLTRGHRRHKPAPSVPQQT